jgi:hypothetical protein
MIAAAGADPPWPYVDESDGHRGGVTREQNQKGLTRSRKGAKQKRRDGEEGLIEMAIQNPEAPRGKDGRAGVAYLPFVQRQSWRNSARIRGELGVRDGLSRYNTHDDTGISSQLRYSLLTLLDRRGIIVWVCAIPRGCGGHTLRGRVRFTGEPTG